MADALGLEPATAADFSAIADCVRRFRLDDENLRVEQFLVARRDGALVAFGRIKPYGGDVYELACVGVLEAERGRDLGAAMVRALIERFPTPKVWITTDLPAYFERFGFRRADDPPAAIADKLVRVCGRLRAGVVAMMLLRPTSGRILGRE